MKPFVKWVGGKTKLLEELSKRMPKNYNNYIEPFVGGGALFFYIKPKNFIINDLNEQLILTYKSFCNKTTYEKLIEKLNKHQQNHNEEYFYKIRALDREKDFPLKDQATKAARMIYLNKTCFNGLYRVNKRGFLNVPFGKKQKINLKDKDNFEKIHFFLKEKEEWILNYDFEEVLKLAKPGDFVYIDPPYSNLDEKKTFTSYTKHNFNVLDQKRLKNWVVKLTKNNVKVMLSNHDSKEIRELYKNFKIEIIYVKRLINCNAKKRKEVPEVIITNY